MSGREAFLHQSCSHRATSSPLEVKGFLTGVATRPTLRRSDVMAGAGNLPALQGQHGIRDLLDRALGHGRSHLLHHEQTGTGDG